MPIDDGPPRTMIPAPVPRERGRIALRTYVRPDGMAIEKGKVYDVCDALVKANPDRRLEVSRRASGDVR